ncbi:hypothetical protein [Actinomadura mexicana]|uniref:Uncharacterized protein n=1 Tax=Actinomadura mexicana TaxID=134959 RepID=A0A238X0L8_9ACTN|nr:hypothetical protein [Actinomadura mexicana]SNR52367.1 hypothetical protein SAMN06265355_103547 [Actinomadura mexicana]
MSGTPASTPKPVWNEDPNGKEGWTHPEAPGPVWNEDPNGKEGWTYPEATEAPEATEPGATPAT